MKAIKFVVGFVLSIALAACAFTPMEQLDAAPDAKLPAPSLEKIADGVWIHKSYKEIEPWGPILSQGLVVQTEAGVFLVDTAWTNEDTSILLDKIEQQIGEMPHNAIVTHAHEDKMGGMDALHGAGVRTWAYYQTNEDAPGRNLTPANNWFGGTFDGTPTSTPFDLEEQFEETLLALSPGPGHTRDNIVVYHAPSKILFGGCLIRPGDSNSLGNTADADIEYWANAVRNVADAFPEAEIVIPSHGAPGGRELLDHTIALAEAAAAELNDD